MIIIQNENSVETLTDKCQWTFKIKYEYVMSCHELGKSFVLWNRKVSFNETWVWESEDPKEWRDELKEEKCSNDPEGRESR